MANTELDLVKMVHNTLYEATLQAQESYLEEATKEFRKRLRSAMADAAIKVDQFYTMETKNQQLIITLVNKENE